MILTLTSNAQNFFGSGDDLQWTFSGNLLLPENAKIALTSLIIDFKERYSPEKAIPVKCSLIQCDEFNPDGIIFSIPGKSRDVLYHANVLERYNCDSSRPHKILFTFDGLPAEKLAYVHINILIDSC